MPMGWTSISHWVPAFAGMTDKKQKEHNMKKILIPILVLCIGLFALTAYAEFSDYLELKVLDHISGKTSFTQPDIYVGLSTTTPADDGTNVTEPSGNGYVRVNMPATYWNAASAGAFTNLSAINFPTPSGSWGTVTYAVVFGNQTGAVPDNLLWYWPLDASKTISSGDTVLFPAGSFSTTLD